MFRPAFGYPQAPGSGGRGGKHVGCGLIMPLELLWFIRFDRSRGGGIYRNMETDRQADTYTPTDRKTDS